MIFHTITQLPIEDKQITLIIACRIRAVAPYTRSDISRKKRKEKVVCAFFFIIFLFENGTHCGFWHDRLHAASDNRRPLSIAKAQKSTWRFRVQDKSDRVQIKEMVKNKRFIRNIYRGKRHLVCSTSAVG